MGRRTYLGPMSQTLDLAPKNKELVSVDFLDNCFPVSSFEIDLSCSIIVD